MEFRTPYFFTPYFNVINEIQKYCAGHIDMSQGMILFGMKTLHLYDFQSSRNNSKKAVKESALVWDIVCCDWSIILDTFSS